MVEITDDDRQTLERLVQLYSYDFHEILGTRMGEDGRYTSIDVGYWWAHARRRGWLVRADGELAGFALAYHEGALRDPEEQVWWMDQFFVLRAYRRRGVGEAAAREVFGRLGGSWEVAQVHGNDAATAFWRTVIARHTGGRYQEFVNEDERWSGPVQHFRQDDVPTAR